MSDQPPNAGGSNAQAPPEASSSAAREPPLIRQFVMDYLQQHGYDRALKVLNDGLKDPHSTDGNVGGSGSVEAFFAAPAPVELTAVVSRNLPQAHSISASTMSERITPEFEAQARYIIEMMEKRTELEDKLAEQAAADGQDLSASERELDSLLDTSEKVQGYRLYQRWVDGCLEMWKVCTLWQ